LVTDKQLTVNKMLSAENSRLQDELINLQKTLAVNRVAAQTDIDKLSGSLKDVITEKLRPVESYLEHRARRYHDK
jgi:CRISPR/Cas system CMR subunit Cmr6 (Cas7 group RAMP superfamily)